MKKIILSLVFVFASFTMVNANSNVKKMENPPNCSTVYDIVWYAVMNYTMDWDFASDIAADAEHDCLAQGLF
ncbi:MAG: hypothetical protein ACOH1N_05095 [Lutibacter sp.]